VNIDYEPQIIEDFDLLIGMKNIIKFYHKH
jgi:hypothetical protein